MLSKAIKISCLVGSIAFLFHAVLAPFYAMGIFRFATSLAFIGIAILLFSFLRRQRWTWLFVLVFTPTHVITSILFPPTETVYGSWIFVAQILVLIESIACATIFVTMLFPGTKTWFTGYRITENINIENFHRGEVLEITYRNNFWDIAWFNFYQTPRIRTVQISFVLIMVAVAFFIFAAPDNTPYSFSIRLLNYAIILISIYLGLAVLSLIILGFISIIRQFDIRATQDYKLSVSENGVIAKTPFKNVVINWSGVEKIQQNSKYILIYLSDQAALVIPKRNLTGNGDEKKLFDYAYQCLEKSKDVNSLK